MPLNEDLNAAGVQDSRLQARQSAAPPLPGPVAGPPLPGTGLGVGGRPADIVVSVIWRSITRVNVVDQTFDAELNIKATAHNGVALLDPSFRGPELKIMNASSLEVVTPPVWRSKGDGAMAEELQVRGTFTSHFDMDQFPLDTQELSVIIQAQLPSHTTFVRIFRALDAVRDTLQHDFDRACTRFSHRLVRLQPPLFAHFPQQCDRAVLRPGPNVTDKQIVRLVVSDTDDPVPCTLVESGVTIAPMLYCTQSMRVQAGHSDEGDSSRSNVYSMIHSSITIERQPGFFWWNLIFPTFLFTNLTFLSMAVPADEPANRLSVTISLMLTAGAYKIIAASAVPEIPHLTLLDQYVVGSLVVSSLVAVQNTIGELTDDADLDRLCGAVLMALWVVFNLCYLARWLFVRLCGRTLRHPTTLLRFGDSAYLSDDVALMSVPRWEYQFDQTIAGNKSAPKRANALHPLTQSSGTGHRI